jgi:hypothetical protein
MTPTRLTSAAHRRLGPLAIAMALAALAGPVVAPAKAGPSTFTTGFADGIYLAPSTTSFWLSRTVAAGAQFILLPVDWAGIAPNRPPAGSDPSDPANPAYHWGTLDQTVRAATARGLTVAFTLAGGGGGPPWADGPHRPGWAQPGTWRPNAAAFGAFAKAVARRYSGTFVPLSGAQDSGGGLLPALAGIGGGSAPEGMPLPRVRYYQAWSEPNLYNHLTPQWVRSHGRWVAESPVIYRALLNSFYAAVKSVSGSNVVITGGTAPFGDQPSAGNGRVPPALFVRELLCLHGQRLTPVPCPDPPHFDVLAHHPYAIGGPWTPAIDADDASLPDIWKLTRALRVAQRTGRVVPRGHQQVWVTEFSWDSNPPDPQGVPALQRARWMEEAFYVLWRQGVDAIAWYLLVDQPPDPDYASTYQSGVYLRSGRAKPGLEGYRFPFVVEPAGRGRATLWGIAPVAGTVLVQSSRSGRWVTLRSFHEHAHGIFTATIRLRGRSLLRARVGGGSSLTWRFG